MEEINRTVIRLAQYEIKSDLAYSVEAKNSESDFEQVCNETIRLIRNSKDNADISFISVKITGYADIQLLEKVQAKKTLTEKEKADFEKVKTRTDEICKAASENGKIVFIDAEESWIQDPLDEITTAMMQKYNKGKFVVYNTLQMYRWDRMDFLKKTFQHALDNGYWYGIKFVRGAYMEKERERAATMNYKSPIQNTKEDTDRDFDAAVEFGISNIKNFGLFIATHNEKSCIRAAELMEEKGLPKNHPHIAFGQLYGMSDHISFNLAKHGYNVAKYIPYGPIKEVIPYLIRRAEENTSIAGQMGRELKLIQREIQRRKIG